MGDAGQSLPSVQAISQETDTDRQHDDLSQRTVNVLVTGFGPFKSFTTNPSFLIASALSQNIDVPSIPSRSLPNKPIRDPHPRPYRVQIHVHLEPILVAYDTTAADIPHLISAGYDYVLHIGLAAGRDNYTLETLAHRDGYIIKDVKGRDGFAPGEQQWRQQSLPQILDVGWHKEEVLRRWEALTNKAEDEFAGAVTACTAARAHGGTTVSIGDLLAQRDRAQQDKTSSSSSVYTSTPTGDKDHSSNPAPDPPGHHPTAATTLTTSTISTSGSGSESKPGSGPQAGKRAEVKLSKDAGRFLCEYILYTSLAHRFREARDDDKKASPSDNEPESDAARERIGKIAFLHVPGGTTPQDTARGARVAVAAIRALVGSWEDGYRNGDVYDVKPGVV